jgi:ribosomal protein S12 methylthiotransferase
MSMLTPSHTVTPEASSEAPSHVKAPDKKHNIGFVHLGCSKNLVDTETMLGKLAQDGHRIVSDESEADIVLVNTCAFIEASQKESVKTLVNLAEAGKELLIAGCLAQKFQGELLELFPEARAVIGTHNMMEVASILERTDKGERVLAIQQDPTFLLEDDTVRKHVTMGASVYLKIGEGCDYRCTFCIIPSMRGNLRSRGIQNIVDNAKALVDKGASEIILVGQDTTSYGKDIQASLPELLEALNEIPDLTWIRFLYAYPNEHLNERLLKTIRDCDKVVKYLDCPLQHSHPEILKRMGRPVTDMPRMAEWVRSIVPDIRLRTTFIVGFPGEEEHHYQHLKQTIETVQWDRVGIFEYSDVDSAASAKLDGKVKKSVMKARRNELMAIQQGISYAHNQALVGQVLPVLIDEIRPSGYAVGRTQWDAPEVDNTVIIRPEGRGTEMLPGELVSVRVVQATPYDLKGDAL